MIARSGSGWQTIIADLALILFMVSISATGAEPAPPPPPTAAPAQAEPSAIYRAVEGGPSLRQWLGEQPQDPRQRLTVIARFSDGDAEAAASAALPLAAEARVAGHRPRILIEPGPGDELIAVLAFDDIPNAHNRAASWHEPCSAPAKDHSGRAGQRDPQCE